MPPDRTLADIAAALDATVVGDGSLPVRDFVHPMAATSATDLVFIMDAALVERLAGTPARAAIVGEDVDLPADLFAGHVVVARPRYVLAALLDLFAKPVHAPPGIAPSAVIDPSAKIGATVSIGPLATVGPDADIGAGTIIMAQVTIGAAAKVGADCLFHPGARIGERVVIGDRAIVHHNASIGADGFSFVTPEVASHERAKHGGDTATARNRGIRRINSIGTVIIGNDVEIGASAAIDRANLGATTIGDGTKIDNHVQIAHNVTIGKDCLLSGQTGISGSVKIGDRVVMAGKSAVVDHVTIGDDVVVGGGSAVWRDVAPGQVMVGYPAVPRNEAFEREVNIGRLKRIIKDVTALKRRLTVMERK